MRLYAGMSSHFILDTVHNQIAGKLKDAFFRHYRYNPSAAEITSWQNSLRAVSQTFEAAIINWGQPLITVEGQQNRHAGIQNSQDSHCSRYRR
jgi:hypothetical protein